MLKFFLLTFIDIIIWVCYLLYCMHLAFMNVFVYFFTSVNKIVVHLTIVLAYSTPTAQLRT